MATKTDILGIQRAAILGYSLMIQELVRRRASLAHSITDDHGELLDEPRQFAKKRGRPKRTVAIKRRRPGSKTFEKITKAVAKINRPAARSRR